MIRPRRSPELKVLDRRVTENSDVSELVSRLEAEADTVLAPEAPPRDPDRPRSRKR